MEPHILLVLVLPKWRCKTQAYQSSDIARIWCDFRHPKDPIHQGNGSQVSHAQDCRICFCPVQSHLWQIRTLDYQSGHVGSAPTLTALLLLDWQKSTRCEMWTGRKVVQWEEIIISYTHGGSLRASQEPCCFSSCYVQVLPFRERIVLCLAYYPV